jgi:hypothetical protein
MMQIGRTRGGDIVADQAETNCFQGNPQAAATAAASVGVITPP